VVNAYTGAGAVEIWLDDLEIQGYVNLDEENGPQISRRPSDPGDPRERADLPAAAAVVQGSLLLVRGRPLMIRAIQHQGEPLEWLKSLGFNAVKLSASPSAADLK